MAKQYWLGEYFVDLSRNQISQHTQSQTLPPKALLVLTHLAENQGRVVTYDELLDKVWANSVVTPNTLQRSIAQLRKALGENSKAQEVIKTHAKQGYSLECDVTWFEEQPDGASKPEAQAPGESAPAQTSPPSAQRQDCSPQAETSAPSPQVKAPGFKPAYWVAAVFALLIAVALSFQLRDSKPAMQFDELRYLTATDDKEYGASYTPDGQHILFNRYFDKLCINHIVAKDAQTMQEVQLTAERGTYEGHSLSPDGKTLVYIKHEDCTKPVTQNICYRLMSLDFPTALSSPQHGQELLRCENSAIRKPVWVNDQRIVMMQHDGERWRLILFSVPDRTSLPLFEVESGNIQHYAYSAKRKQLAVTLKKNDGLQYINILDLKGTVLSSHAIDIPEDAPRFMTASPVFSGQADTLVFSFSGQLYTLSEQGQVTHVPFPFNQSAGGPAFHPDSDRLLLIKGSYDGDVATLTLPADGEDSAPEVFERSIEEEQSARFRPNADGIAFLSKRTGEDQIWLRNEAGTRMISDFPNGTNVWDFQWDDAGESLLALANFELHLMSPGADSRPVGFAHPVTNLFHWDSTNQRVTASILVNGLFKFVEINLTDLQYRVINQHKVKRATKSADSPLIFSDAMSRLWQHGEVEAKLITPLAGQASEKGFVLDGQTLYGINRDLQLWSYHLPTEAFEILTEVTPDIDYLTDARGNTLLLSMQVAAKKEVIELTVRQ